MSPMRSPSWRSRRPTAPRRPRSRSTTRWSVCRSAHGTPEQKERSCARSRAASARRFLPHRTGRRSDAAAITTRPQRSATNLSSMAPSSSSRPARAPTCTRLCRHRPGCRQARHLGLHRSHARPVTVCASSTRWAALVRSLPDRLRGLRSPARADAGRGRPRPQDRAGQPRRRAHRCCRPVSRHGAFRLRCRTRLRQDRRTFGKPIIEHQAVGFRLADMATSLQAAELMVLHAAQLRDAGEPCLKEASMAKLFASEMAEQVCSAPSRSMAVMATSTTSRRARLSRCQGLHDLRGTSDIQRLVIGRQLAAEFGFQGVSLRDRTPVARQGRRRGQCRRLRQPLHRHRLSLRSSSFPAIAAPGCCAATSTAAPNSSPSRCGTRGDHRGLCRSRHRQGRRRARGPRGAEPIRRLRAATTRSFGAALRPPSAARAGSRCRRSGPACRAAPRCAGAGCTWRAGPSATASRS